jgi:hypothetical protein
VNTCSSRTDMNRLKRGYAVRSIDAITHPDQLPLRQADLTNAIGRAGPDGHHHPSSPGAPLQSAEPHSMIHSWRVLCLPWPHPLWILISSRWAFRASFESWNVAADYAPEVMHAERLAAGVGYDASIRPHYDGVPWLHLAVR